MQTKAGTIVPALCFHYDICFTVSVNDTGFLSILLIALGLSADCFAVSLAGSTALRRISIYLAARTGIAFGVFQAGMTLIGWLAGERIIEYIESYDHWLAFGLLAFIGGKMIWESFRGGSEESGEKEAGITRWPTLIVLAVATSIDALAVGLSFAFLKINIVSASTVIGITAFVITLLGLFIGKKMGAIVGRRSETIGGIILIGIGIKILLEHLL